MLLLSSLLALLPLFLVLLSFVVVVVVVVVIRRPAPRACCASRFTLPFKFSPLFLIALQAGAPWLLVTAVTLRPCCVLPRSFDSHITRLLETHLFCFRAHYAASSNLFPVLALAHTQPLMPQCQLLLLTSVLFSSSSSQCFTRTPALCGRRGLAIKRSFSSSFFVRRARLIALSCCPNGTDGISCFALTEESRITRVVLPPVSHAAAAP
ncbi:hypothetical protein BKA62DRAFT_330896 [Auriculariales sp. MPI-PUGE-AT-0066]|nr:hypothetical protein BKA62DRAFT_330896 [Auriculariales sp. MPI-PUGE-AT-0066]